jgi:hypothetical protein
MGNLGCVGKFSPRRNWSNFANLQRFAASRARCDIHGTRWTEQSSGAVMTCLSASFDHATQAPAPPAV